MTIVFLIMLLDVTGLGIIIPVLPKLLMQLTGSDLSHAAEYGGWMLFAYAVMQFLMSPVLGGLSDAYGRRPVLLFSLLGFGVDYVFMGLAPTVAWLFVGRIIAGIMGASFSTAGAYIADVSPPEKRAQNFGLMGAAFGLGFILGPLLGGLLGQYGPRVPFFASAAFTLLNWVFAWFMLPESLPAAQRRPFEWRRANAVGSLMRLGKNPFLLSLTWPFLLIVLAGYATQSTWTYYTMYKFGWDERMVGWSLSFVGVMAAMVQGGLTRRLIPKLGNHRSIYVGLSLYAVGMALYAVANQGWMMFAVTVLAALGGIAMPALQSIMSNQVPINEQGELRGALTSLMSLTSIVGPLLMTYLFAWFTAPTAHLQMPGAPFWAGFVFLLVSLGLLALAFRHEPPPATTKQ